MTVTRYLLTIILAAIGALLLAGGAVLLWLQPTQLAATLLAIGAAAYIGAMLLTARPRL